MTYHLLNRPWTVALAFAGSAAGVVAVVGKRSRGLRKSAGEN